MLVALIPAPINYLRLAGIIIEAFEFGIRQAGLTRGLALLGEFSVGSEIGCRVGRLRR